MTELAQMHMAHERTEEAAMGFHRSSVYLKILQSRLPSDSSRQAGEKLLKLISSLRLMIRNRGQSQTNQ